LWDRWKWSSLGKSLRGKNSTDKEGTISVNHCSRMIFPQWAPISILIQR
jgi:hypothetical protein